MNPSSHPPLSVHPILLLLLPGGTIVPGGGYVAGRQKLIGAVAARLAAPGIGIDAGQVSGTTLRLMYQGVPAVRTKGQLALLLLGAGLG